jgi:hypothetical protein
MSYNQRLLLTGVAKSREWFGSLKDGAPPEVAAALERVDAALAELDGMVRKHLVEEKKAPVPLDAAALEAAQAKLASGVSSANTALQGKHGRLVAHILDAFAADPDVALTVADVAMPAYGVPLRQVTKAHRVAVLRAMRRLNQLDRRWQLMNGEGAQGQVVLYDGSRVLSYGLARLKADYLRRYQYRERDTPDEAALRARIAPGGEDHRLVVPGGAWWRRTLLRLAKLAGDAALVERLEAEAECGLRAMTARISRHAGRAA